MSRINFVVEPQGGIYREYPHRVSVYSDDGKSCMEDDFPKGTTIEQLMNCYHDFMEEKGERRRTMNTKEHLTNLYKVQIKNWVLENFGESEAEDPSWNIEALADYLADHAHLVYDTMEDGWRYEDVQYIAREYLGGKLDHDHAMRAVQYYKEMDEYQEINRQAIEYAIKETEEK